MTAQFTRRHAVQLGAVILGGWGIGRWARSAQPVGRDIGWSATVAAILDPTESPVSGPVDATLRLAVFSDYRCPACRQAFPALEIAAAADGGVQILYKDWPIFGAESERLASIALASAAQGLYPALHRRLMTDARRLDDRILRDLVHAVGGDWERILSDLTTRRAMIAAQIRQNAREALAIGLAGTPGYLAGSVLVTGAIDVSGFVRLFAQARAAA
jgi:protein-disulfide isomerase